jgi:all-trans-retinol 13,14-reductase
MAVSYKQTKPEGTFDYIIIGSGLSGVSLAAILAKEGKRCLVLERHYTPGGFTHTFKRRDYEWDVGVHYVGQVHRKHSFLARAFDYITEKPIEWAEMDDVYDRMIFGEKSYDFRKGPKEFAGQIKTYFDSPKDQAAVDKYLQEVRNAGRSARGLFATRALPPMVNRLTGGFVSRKARPYTSRTTRQVLESITGNEELIGVLTGQYGDYGLTPGKSSFLMHALLSHHYLHGGAYPTGGSGSIFNAIEPTIESAGGAVYTNAEVETILTDKGRAVGVKMTDGNEILAQKVISSIGMHNTYEKLIPEVTISEKLRSIKPSIGHLCLYLGLKGSQKDLQLPKTNLWIYPNNYNHDENMDRYIRDPENEDLPVAYVSFPSAKDPDWERRYPGRSTIEIITLGQMEHFRKWQDGSWKKRGEDYESLKEKFSGKLLEKLYSQLPQLRGKVDYHELSTPLSTMHFTNYSSGEIYGLEHSPERFTNRQISVYTPLKNFYLTGQDIVSCGVGGALLSGIITSMVLTGRKSFSWIMEN